MSNEIQAGDTVRVKNPDEFFHTFASKVRDRDAIVRWIGPDKHGQFKGRAGVTFQKRNGRGKEFNEIMSLSHLEKKTS